MPPGLLYNPFEGATLLIPSGQGHHLFVVVTKPCADNKVALVNITSILQGKRHDETCLLRPGDHEFIRHDSWVYYRRARTVTVSTLRAGVASGLFIPKHPVKASLFERIRDGFLVSSFVSPVMRNYVAAQFAKS